MQRKQQSRRWLVASVAVVALLALLLQQLEQAKIYQNLRAHFAKAGITLQAKQAALSWMYLGSIRLDDVSMHGKSFELEAQRLFIDLDLAALLTGKALAQALYLQFADINILQNHEQTWLQSIENNHFRLNRIDISQSEIHFDEQHLTLEHVDLDIRDIGKNKNPRLELRAHIGDGRLDAHGFLHLRQGKVSRGFGRLRLHDIPLQFLQGFPASQTLNGSITTHINQDSTWQSFGHLSLNKGRKNTMKLRGQLTGNDNTWFHVEDLVFTIPTAGAMILSGQCKTSDDCNFGLQSRSLSLAPLFKALERPQVAQSLHTSTIDNIKMQAQWKNNLLSSSGQLTWQDFTYDNISLQAGSFSFQNLKRQAQAQWTLQHALLYENQDKAASIALNDAVYDAQHLILPLTLNSTPLWQQGQQIFNLVSKRTTKVKGSGRLQGTMAFHIMQQSLNSLKFNLDASQAQIQWQEASKPEAIPLIMQGEISFDTHQYSKDFDLKVTLGKQYADVHYTNSSWHIPTLHINFNALQQQGITLPHLLQGWHGGIAGSLDAEHTLTAHSAINNSWNITQAKLKLRQFGVGDHRFNGQLEKQTANWMMKDLTWNHGMHNASISTDHDGNFTMSAGSIDSNTLLTMQALPFFKHGIITSQKLHLPFASLQQFSSLYTHQNNMIHLANVVASLHQGSFRAKQLYLSANDNHVQLKGTVQMGGVQLEQLSWLHQQLQHHVAGKLYATIYIQADFDSKKQLGAWRGDGQIVVYNAVGAFDHLNLTSNSLSIDFKKKESFISTFQAQLAHDKGKGKLHIDANMQADGQYQWKHQLFTISQTWPKVQVRPILSSK